MTARSPPGLFATALVAALALAAPARADGLGEDELARLWSGEVVSRDVDAELPEGRFVGGVSYAIVHAPAAYVMKALLDPAAYVSILPLTLEAREVARRDDDRFVFFRQGSRFGTAEYTLRVRPESDTLIRFWMEPTAPHDVEDAWGFFRVVALGPEESLVTYAAVVDLGFGFVRLLFEEKVRRYALGTPGLIRRYVEGRYRGGAPAAAGPPSRALPRGNVAASCSVGSSPSL